jgi:hypothetical protein
MEGSFQLLCCILNSMGGGLCLDVMYVSIQPPHPPGPPSFSSLRKRCELSTLSLSLDCKHLQVEVYVNYNPPIIFIVWRP